jgi:SAM-dependent methyltransferase
VSHETSSASNPSLCPVGCGVALEPMGRWAPYRTCPQCGVGFWRPPTADAYWGQGVEPSEAQHRFWSGRTEQWEAVVGKGPGRLLDVGCGFGHFVKWAQEAGWDAWGYDNDVWAAEHTQAPGRVISELTAVEPPFDVITLWDTLEHVAKPINLLLTLRTMMATRGKIVICSPNFDALKLRWPYLRRRADRFNYVVRPLEHFLQFTEKSLRLSLDRAGFSRTYVVRPPPSHRANRFVMLALQRFSLLRKGMFVIGELSADGSSFELD